MNKILSLRTRRIQIIAISVILGFSLVWVMRTISIAYQKGVISGRSVRVALVNACTVTSYTNTNKPNFTGCNSIT